MKILMRMALGLLALMIGCVAFLGWRVAYHWERAPARVAEILADADPALGAISQERLAWLIRVEDPTFWTNDGIDQLTPGAGRTTLAQGLGKRIFFKRFSPGPLRFGKLELMALTRLVLVERVSKRDILHAVLASAYLGDDQHGSVNGFAEGARRWFGKDTRDLTDREFLALVAMMPAPNQLDPVDHASENEGRVRRIERLLAGECAPISVDDIYYVRCSIP